MHDYKYIAYSPFSGYVTERVGIHLGWWWASLRVRRPRTGWHYVAMLAPLKLRLYSTGSIITWPQESGMLKPYTAEYFQTWKIFCPFLVTFASRQRSVWMGPWGLCPIQIANVPLEKAWWRQCPITFLGHRDIKWVLNADMSHIPLKVSWRGQCPFVLKSIPISDSCMLAHVIICGRQIFLLKTIYILWPLSTYHKFSVRLSVYLFVTRKFVSQKVLQVLFWNTN